MKPVHGVALIGAVVALFAVAGSPSAQAQRPARQAWDYNVDEVSASFDREDRLNRRGAQGWELVAVEGNTYVFKRPH